MCSHGWFQREYPFCYRIAPRPKTFQAAQTSCKRMGGNLASIRDVTEAIFLGRHLKGKFYWIGLYNIKNDENFVWTDGSRVTFRNFLRNPNNGGNGHCVQLVRMPAGYKWKLVKCAKESPYICKKKGTFTIFHFLYKTNSQQT